jgi:predicted O-methyltransferase YrrM
MFNKIFAKTTASVRNNKIAELISIGLPKEMVASIKYLVSKIPPDEETNNVIKCAENRRNEIANKGDEKIQIMYSPKPGSSGVDVGVNARPLPGKVLEFTMERVAKTGKNQTWGTALYLIAREFSSSVIVELGSCAGISAIYLSSAKNVVKLITVEGSQALAEIAKESLKKYKNAEVINALFDDAIDKEISELQKKIELVYIDGHHEKVATIHYFNRLIPFLDNGAVVVFDDISWSHDMRDAWSVLSKRSEFAHAMDLGAIGICIMKNNYDNFAVEPKYWDLQPVVGRHKTGDPRGWSE